MRRAHPRRQQLPPQSLALGVALIYAAITSIGRIVLTASPGQDAAPTIYQSQPSTMATDTSYLKPTTTTTIDSKPDFIQVSGSRGITVEVPDNWPKQSFSWFIDEVQDPMNDLRLLRYGSELATNGRKLVDQISDSEADAAAKEMDRYLQIRLEPFDFYDKESVLWEYAYYDKYGDKLHCVALYWILDDTMYILYAQSAESDWKKTQPVLQHMIDTAGPIR